MSPKQQPLSDRLRSLKSILTGQDTTHEVPYPEDAFDFGEPLEIFELQRNTGELHVEDLAALAGENDIKTLSAAVGAGVRADPMSNGCYFWHESVDLMPQICFIAHQRTPLSCDEHGQLNCPILFQPAKKLTRYLPISMSGSAFVTLGRIRYTPDNNQFEFWPMSAQEATQLLFVIDLDGPNSDGYSQSTQESELVRGSGATFFWPIVKSANARRFSFCFVDVKPGNPEVLEAEQWRTERLQEMRKVYCEKLQQD